MLDVYTELRRTMSAKSYDVLTLLPDSPSSLRTRGPTTFTERANLAVANLSALPDADVIKITFLAPLKKELAEFQLADKAEDTTRAALQSSRMALTLYKTELSQASEAELGKIQSVLGNREKTSLFTVPWRKPSRTAADKTTETGGADPPEETPPEK